MLRRCRCCSGMKSFIIYVLYGRFRLPVAVLFAGQDAIAISDF